MKTLVIILTITAVVNAQQPSYGGCAQETGANETFIKRIKNKDFDFSDSKVNSFFLCMFNKMGILTKDGAFHKDVALSIVPEEKKEIIGKIIDECIGQVGSTYEETSWNYAKCFNEKLPQHDYIEE